MTARWRRIAAAAALVAGPISIAAVPVLRRGAPYPFVASSKMPGYEKSGVFGQVGAYGVFFHTAQEQSPWIEVDLGEPREVREVEIDNRFDCCRERAVPLVLELAGDDRVFSEASRVAEPFERVSLRPAGSPRARYVRLRAEAVTMLHLAAVRVR